MTVNTSILAPVRARTRLPFIPGQDHFPHLTPIRDYRPLLPTHDVRPTATLPHLPLPFTRPPPVVASCPPVPLPSHACYRAAHSRTTTPLRSPPFVPFAPHVLPFAADIPSHPPTHIHAIVCMCAYPRAHSGTYHTVCGGAIPTAFAFVLF